MSVQLHLWHMRTIVSPLQLKMMNYSRLWESVTPEDLQLKLSIQTYTVNTNNDIKIHFCDRFAVLITSYGNYCDVNIQYLYFYV